MLITHKKYVNMDEDERLSGNIDAPNVLGASEENQIQC